MVETSPQNRWKALVLLYKTVFERVQSDQCEEICDHFKFGHKCSIFSNNTIKRYLVHKKFNNEELNDKELASLPLNEVCDAVAWYTNLFLTPLLGLFPIYGILFSLYAAFEYLNEQT